MSWKKKTVNWKLGQKLAKKDLGYHSWSCYPPAGNLTPASFPESKAIEGNGGRIKVTELNRGYWWPFCRSPAGPLSGTSLFEASPRHTAQSFLIAKAWLWFLFHFKSTPRMSTRQSQNYGPLITWRKPVCLGRLAHNRKLISVRASDNSASTDPLRVLIDHDLVFSQRLL